GLCFGIDVGGTFTDCVLTDGTAIWRAKAPSTPGEIGKGVLAAAELASRRRGASLKETMSGVVRFGLGTTAITNVLASRTGRKVGFVTTAGFEEMLLFARGERIVDSEGWLGAPPSLVGLRQIAGIQERIDREGRIVTPLDVKQTEAALRRLVEVEKVEAIA